MNIKSAKSKSLISVTKAAEFLGLSADTLRNWEKQGKLVPSRTAGGSRRYSITELADFKKDLGPYKPKSLITVSKAAKSLNVSADTIRNWDKKGLLATERSKGGARRFSRSEIKRLQNELGISEPVIAHTVSYAPPSAPMAPKVEEPVTSDHFRNIFFSSLKFTGVVLLIVMGLALSNSWMVSNLENLFIEQSKQFQKQFQNLAENLDATTQDLLKLEEKRQIETTQSAVLGINTIAQAQIAPTPTPLLAGTDISIDSGKINNTSTLASLKARGGCSGCIASSDIGSVSGGSINGTVPVGVGGTGQTSYSKGDLLYANDTNSLSKLPVGSAGQVLSVSSSGTLTWVNKSDLDNPISFGVEKSFIDGDATPDVSEGNRFITGTTALTITSFDAGTGILKTGHVIFVKSNGAITYEVHTSNLIGGDTDLVTAVGDLTSWIFDGTNWTLINWMKNSETQLGADLAEYYISDQKLTPGTVVSSSLISPTLVVASEIPYDQRTIGVVSTNPGIVLGGPAKENTYPIALAGRVPVKISLENGSIKPGDYLTSSSTPGVAMKASKAGQVLGKALEASNKASSTILAIIQPGFADPKRISTDLDSLVKNLKTPEASAASLEASSSAKLANTFLATGSATILSPEKVFKTMEATVSGTFKALSNDSLDKTSIQGGLSLEGTILFENGSSVDVVGVGSCQLPEKDQLNDNSCSGVFYLRKNPQSKSLFKNLKAQTIIVAELNLDAGKIVFNEVK